MPRVRPIIECRSCGRHKPHQCRGLCGACFSRHRNAGTLEQFPRATRRRSDLVEDWAELRAQGYTRRAAADRLGVSWECLDKAIQRSRHQRQGEAAA